ncbi:unnamed protein product [Prunus armeniaca]|uniref:Uncharacterized protein n=1 Tax=Prunus armeniaca TaxID=36596 RepID=A0A6J5XRV9_PRUAR|nr:unnamed protein product [Prunus armeniaca]CAB4316459.1 unnamed protein product [Prunus armeniaca]
MAKNWEPPPNRKIGFGNAVVKERKAVAAMGERIPDLRGGRESGGESTFTQTNILLAMKLAGVEVEEYGVWAVGRGGEEGERSIQRERVEEEDDL